MTARVSGGGVSRPVGQGSNVDVLCAEPKEHRPGTRPGGSVTGVTEKLFMCQMSRLSFPATGLPNPGRVSEGFQKGSLKGS